METTETTATLPLPEPELVLIPQARYYLHTAGRWANFLGILGFVFTGFIVLQAIFIGGAFSHLQQYQGLLSYGSGSPSMYGDIIAIIVTVVRVTCVLTAVVCFFFSYYLYQFASQVKKAVLFNDSLQLSTGIESLKSFFKLWGITTIVTIVLYLLIIIGSVIFVANAASAMHG